MRRRLTPYRAARGEISGCWSVGGSPDEGASPALAEDTRSEAALEVDRPGTFAVGDDKPERVTILAEEAAIAPGKALVGLHGGLEIAEFLILHPALIDDLEELVGKKLILDEDDEDLDTVGGLIVTTIDRVPERGELITHPAGLEFEIMDADPRRVKKLRVRIKNLPARSHSSEASIAPAKISE